jgi:predicted transcriptional regulator
MISLIPNIDLSQTIKNQTMKRLYTHMDKDKLYTRKLLSQETGIPFPTVVARIAGMIQLNLVRVTSKSEIKKV